MHLLRSYLSFCLAPLFLAIFSVSVVAAQNESIPDRIRRAQNLDKSPPNELTTNDWSFISSEVYRGRGSNLINVLARTIHQRVPGHVMRAITDLGQIGPAAAPVVPLLVESFETMEEELHKWYLAHSFGKIGLGASNAVPALIRSIQTKDSARPAAIDALGGIGKPAFAAIPILTELSNTADTDLLAFSCVNALARISPDPSPHLPLLISQLELPKRRDTIYITAIEAMETFEVLGPKAKAAIPALVKQLDFPGEEHVRASARALAAMGPHAAAAEIKLRAIMDSSRLDEQTRVVVAESLGTIMGGYFDGKAKAQEIKLAERKKEKKQWDKLTKKQARYTTSLPEVTRVQVSRISSVSARSPDQVTFPVGNEKHGAVIHSQTNLVGPAAFQFAAAWRSLDFGFEFQALCHEPAFGLRFYSGKKLLFQTSVCWKCQNFTVPSGFMGFDADSPSGNHLLRRLNEVLPEPAGTANSAPP